jgi:hypothetical protein
MRKMNVEKLFGVPASIFADADDALVWLGERVMAPRGLPFDLAAVRAAIRSARLAAAVS